MKRRVERVVNKADILNNICYTELVYERINKKLNGMLSRGEIEKMIFETIEQTPETFFHRKGKNVYITSHPKGIRVTVNSNTFRVITVDAIDLKQL